MNPRPMERMIALNDALLALAEKHGEQVTSEFAAKHQTTIIELVKMCGVTDLCAAETQDGIEAGWATLEDIVLDKQLNALCQADFEANPIIEVP